MLHDDYDKPPDIPAFSGIVPKRPRRESLGDALSDVAVAITKAFTSSNDKVGEQVATAPSVTNISHPAGVSPGKAVEFRMRNFEQLRYLQQLYDDD